MNARGLLTVAAVVAVSGTACMCQCLKICGGTVSLSFVDGSGTPLPADSVALWAVTNDNWGLAYISCDGGADPQADGGLSERATGCHDNTIEFSTFSDTTRTNHSVQLRATAGAHQFTGVVPTTWTAEPPPLGSTCSCGKNQGTATVTLSP